MTTTDEDEGARFWVCAREDDPFISKLRPFLRAASCTRCGCAVVYDPALTAAYHRADKVCIPCCFLIAKEAADLVLVRAKPQ